MVINDAVATATVPVDRRRSRAQKQVADCVLRRVGPDLSNEYCPLDNAIAAAAEVHNSIADNQYDAVPVEITIHPKSTGHGENAVAIRAAGEGNVAIDVVVSPSRRSTVVNIRACIRLYALYVLHQS